LRYANGKFESIPLPRPHEREFAVTAMGQGNGGAILLSGLIKGVLKFRGGQFETLAEVTALPSSPVTALAESSDGKMWLGTQHGGLFYRKKGRVTAGTKGLPSKKINALLAAGDGAVWIGTDGGVTRWNGFEITAAGEPPALRRVQALTMLADR